MKRSILPRVYVLSVATALPLASSAAAPEPPSRLAPELAAPGTAAVEKEPHPSKVPSENAPGAVERTFSGRITAVNREEQTITVEDRQLGAQRLRIGEDTKLKRGQAAGSWDDLQVGRSVSGVSRGQPGETHVDWLEVAR